MTSTRPSTRLPIAACMAFAAISLMAHAAEPGAVSQPTTTQPAVTQAAATRSAAQPDETAFPLVHVGPPLPAEPRALWGPRVPLQERTPGPGGDPTDINRDSVHGPVWDGVNNGLWLARGNVALLVDRATGRQMRRMDVPSPRIVGHDGVGLWLWVPQDHGTSSRQVLRRIHTAPGLSTRMQARGLSLPEDLPTTMDRAAFKPVDVAPDAELFTSIAATSDVGRVPTCYITADNFGAGTRTVHGRLDSYAYLHRAAGRLWIYDGAILAGIPWADIPPLPLPEGDLPRRAPHVLARTKGTADGADQSLYSLPAEQEQQQVLERQRRNPTAWERHLTWDGHRLWTLAPAPQQPDSAADDRMIALRLVCIDVGLDRRPDTTERYQKALAFEQEHGTLKAIPLFEQIIADDPSAADVRNHLAWALGTRPQEPYHDIERAMSLVKEALEWEPWDPEKWDTLAELYWRMGHNDLAVRLEAKAINLNPGKTFYWQQLQKFRRDSDEARRQATEY